MAAVRAMLLLLRVLLCCWLAAAAAIERAAAQSPPSAARLEVLECERADRLEVLANLRGRLLSVEREAAVARDALLELDRALEALDDSAASADSRGSLERHLHRLPEPAAFRRRIEARRGEREHVRALLVDAERELGAEAVGARVRSLMLGAAASTPAQRQTSAVRADRAMAGITAALQATGAEGADLLRGLAALDLAEGALAERIEAWVEAVRQVLQRPVAGPGPERGAAGAWYLVVLCGTALLASGWGAFRTRPSARPAQATELSTAVPPTAVVRHAIAIPLRVPHGSSVGSTRLAALRSAWQSAHVLDDPEPDWRFSAFGSTDLEYQLRVHLRNGNVAGFVGELHRAVHSEPQRAGVEVGEPSPADA